MPATRQRAKQQTSEVGRGKRLAAWARGCARSVVDAACQVETAARGGSEEQGPLARRPFFFTCSRPRDQPGRRLLRVPRRSLALSLSASRPEPAIKPKPQRHESNDAPECHPSPPCTIQHWRQPHVRYRGVATTTRRASSSAEPAASERYAADRHRAAAAAAAAHLLLFCTQAHAAGRGSRGYKRRRASARRVRQR